MNLSGAWYYDTHNIELAVDLLVFLILFLLIFLFNLSKQRLLKCPIKDPSLYVLSLLKK